MTRLNSIEVPVRQRQHFLQLKLNSDKAVTARCTRNRLIRIMVWAIFWKEGLLREVPQNSSKGNLIHSFQFAWKNLSEWIKTQHLKKVNLSQWCTLWHLNKAVLHWQNRSKGQGKTRAQSKEITWKEATHVRGNMNLYAIFHRHHRDLNSCRRKIRQTSESAKVPSS